jgi:hypothetical protein
LEQEIAEIRLILLVSLALLVVTSLPTAFGYLSAPPDRWFSGVVYNMHDTAQYFSWMRDAGQTFFTDNKMTAEPTPAIFVNLHWWIPGRIGAILDLTPIQIYLILRLLRCRRLLVEWSLFSRTKSASSCILAHNLNFGFGLVVGGSQVSEWVG